MKKTRHPGTTFLLTSFFLYQLILFPGSCKSVANALYKPDPGELIADSIVDSMDGNREISVLFATNRALSGKSDCTNRHYSILYSDKLKFASCTVHVPQKHNVGSLSSGDFRSDPDTYFGSSNHIEYEQEEWFDMLKGKPVLLFVHGFNVPFEEALARAAQIKYDAKYQGEIVLFSWPAGAEDSIIENLIIRNVYTKNQQSAQKSIDLFSDFVEKLSNNATRLDILVHSMGHQVVIPALLKKGAIGKKIAKELIMQAPDYPATDFVRSSPVIKKTADRVTIYCSPGDNALVASRMVNRNYRIGMCKKVQGIDVINVNEIDSPALGVGGLGHGYYSGRPLMADLFQLLLGIPANKRLFIRKSGPGHGEDYVLRD